MLSASGVRLVDRLPDYTEPTTSAICTAQIGFLIAGISHYGGMGDNGAGKSTLAKCISGVYAPRADNARFFGAGRSVPARAITRGIATISAAARLVLIACGAHKAEAVARALEGSVTAVIPASALQLHPRVMVVLDRRASSGLARWVS